MYQLYFIIYALPKSTLTSDAVRNANHVTMEIRLKGTPAIDSWIAHEDAPIKCQTLSQNIGTVHIYSDWLPFVLLTFRSPLPSAEQTSYTSS